MAKLKLKKPLTNSGFYVYGMISKDSVVIRQLKNLRSLNIDDVKREAIESVKDDIVNNQRDQLRAGRMGNGVLPDYSPRSQTLKDRSNYKAKWPTMDLYNTGSFQEKMKMEVLKLSTLIDSTDSKTDDLVSRFSDQIFEPDKKTMKLNIYSVTPVFMKLVYQKMNV